VTARPEATLTREDILAVPEIYGGRLQNLFPGIPKVILNQGAYLTFSGQSFSLDKPTKPLYGQDVLGIITVSEDSLQYLRYAFPQLDIYRVTHSIQPDLFHPRAQKQPHIAFMTRKLPEDAIQVLHILQQKNQLEGFHVIPIQNKSEQEVAEILRTSLFFLSFSVQEGCPLPPMEAMASGCVVVGYTGRGGQEFFRPKFSYPIETGDIIGSREVKIFAQARLIGNIQTPVLSVQPGAVLHGNCQMLTDASGEGQFVSGEFLTAEELAKYLEVETQVVVDWAEKGRIPSVKEGDSVCFDRSKIDEWIAQEKIK